MSEVFGAPRVFDSWALLAFLEDESSAGKVDEITRLGFKIIVADWPLTRQAASFKARYRLAYADCFAAALGKLHQCPVVTGDPEFKQLEKEIQVLWI
jgi:predicted nucleic acid-binding protein